MFFSEDIMIGTISTRKLPLTTYAGYKNSAVSRRLGLDMRYEMTLYLNDAIIVVVIILGNIFWWCIFQGVYNTKQLISF